MTSTTKVEIANVRIEKGRSPTAFTGGITLTPHVMLFNPSATSLVDKDLQTIWLSTIVSIDRKFPTPDGLYPIYITLRYFLALKIYFAQDLDAATAYTAMQRGMNITSLNQVFAFTYKKELSEPLPSRGWSVFDPNIEYASRMGVGSTCASWRLSTINQNYHYSPTYPAILAVPSRISDNVLKHIGKFRSKSRIPALSYIHRTNQMSITRSSQPMIGLKHARSIQDEKLVEAIFASASTVPKPGFTNLIIDARPTTNAIAQTAMGAGTESSENYKGCRISYLGIDNIHVVRDSFNKLFDAFVSPETTHISKSALDRSGWLKHIRNILDGTLQIVQSVHLHNAHVLVHCSDGWDRTAQLSSLAQLCLDPYYRTIDGLQVLLEKEWVSFGHKFKDRCGHLCHDSPSLSAESGVSTYGSNTSAGSVGSVANSTTQIMATQFQVASKSVSASFSSAAKSFLDSGKKSFFGISSGSTSLDSTQNISSVYSSAVSQPSILASSETLTPNNVAPREISPVFPQFLDCLYQLWTQFPNHFEFDERLLGFLFIHLYSCQFGTFLFNNERERREFTLNTSKGASNGMNDGSKNVLLGNSIGVSGVASEPGVNTSSEGNDNACIQNATVSIWDHIAVNRESFLNPLYTPPLETSPSAHPNSTQTVDKSDPTCQSLTATLNATTLDNSNSGESSSVDPLSCGSGTGRVSMLGVPGAISQDHSILFPSTSNLRFWTSFYIKNGPFPVNRANQSQQLAKPKTDDPLDISVSKSSAGSSAFTKPYFSLDRPSASSASIQSSGLLESIDTASNDPLFSPLIPTLKSVRPTTSSQFDELPITMEHPYTMGSTSLSSTGSKRVSRPTLSNPWASSTRTESNDNGTPLQTVDPTSDIPSNFV
ncbi:hypothetical protein BDV3_006878 [Batrachochytrium dendrobatidis]